MTVYHISEDFKSYLLMKLLEVSHVCKLHEPTRHNVTIPIIKRFEKDVHSYIRFIKNPVFLHGTLIFNIWDIFRNIRVESVNYNETMEVDFTVDMIDRTRVLDTLIPVDFYNIVDDHGLTI
ncbi:MAG: hypothetical protein KAS32_00605 [Candidatus Peribacteraceae bacterium]|nr:hypothetical protein [Candidatus Peribacteraceae bacterium]